jgi:hypothetical protein
LSISLACSIVMEKRSFCKVILYSPTNAPLLRHFYEELSE